MSPTLKNICRANREQDGYHSFAEWFYQENNVYIGRNASKYTQSNIGESKWANPVGCKYTVIFSFLVITLYVCMLQFILCDGVGVDREWMMIELLKLYEKYVRNNPFLMSSLHELKEKELGCWCTPSPCHGDILIKLYLETLAEKSPAEQSGNEKHVAEKKRKFT